MALSPRTRSSLIDGDNLPDLLLQLTGHLFGPSEAPAVRRSRWAGWFFCTLAAIFLLVGLWQLALLSFGPILAPLLVAALAGIAATGFSFYSRRAAIKASRTPKNGLGPLMQPQLLLAALELWLTPRSLRRTVFTGLVLNFMNRKLFR